MKVIEWLFVTMLRSLFGVVENVTSGITRITKCIELLFFTMLRLLFGCVENVTSGIKKIIECISVNACIYYIT